MRLLPRSGCPAASRRVLQRILTAALLLGLGNVLWTHRVLAQPLGDANCVVDLAHLAADTEEQAILDGTNRYRADNGLPPLQFSYALTVAALWKSTDMATQHYITHDEPGRTWAQRLLDCGYDPSASAIGENLAAGRPSGVTTLKQWQNSPLHNENLLDPSFRAVGIKRMPSNDAYGWYWSMELGSTLDADLTSGPIAP